MPRSAVFKTLFLLVIFYGALLKPHFTETFFSHYGTNFASVW